MKTSIIIDTLAYQPGDLLYNPGKFGDAPGWGTITKVNVATSKHPQQYVIDMGPDYYDKEKRYITIPHYCLKPGVGQLFVTPQEYEQCRQRDNERLNEWYKLLDRKPLA